MSLKFNLIATDGNARRGAVETAHGTFQTPSFMAVGTAATVKALTMDQVRATGTEVILGNTYHLMMRPGGDLVERMGGLHKFGGWHGPILTDSGGFQDMSLSNLVKMKEEGVEFTSHIDGGIKHFLRPEDSVHIQHQLDSKYFSRNFYHNRICPLKYLYLYHNLLQSYSLKYKPKYFF